MRTRSILLAAALSASASLAIALPARGQTSSYYGGTTTSGMFGSNTLGGSSASRANYGSSSANSRGTTGTGGNAATGAQNVAQTARQQQAGAGTTGTQTPGAFIGADTSDTGNFRSMQQGQQRNNNNLNQLRNLFSQSQEQINSQSTNQAQGGGQGQSKTPLRISLKLGFKSQPVSVARFGDFQTRITQIQGIQWVTQPDIVLEGRTAVLRGIVASEDDRQMAAALARMEPEVLDVRNLLVVDSSETTAEELPPQTPGSR